MKSKKVLMVFGLLLVVFTFIFTTNSVSTAKTTKIKLKVSKIRKLKVKNIKGKLKWKSSNKKIVLVSNKGIIKAKKTGTAFVTATNGKKSVKFKVTVKKNKKQSNNALPIQTAEPTYKPTIVPTEEPTIKPTAAPTIEPTLEPTLEPTPEPTQVPTPVPTLYPNAMKDPFAISGNYGIDEDEVGCRDKLISLKHSELMTNVLVEKRIDYWNYRVRVFEEDGSSRSCDLHFIYEFFPNTAVKYSEIHKTENITKDLLASEGKQVEDVLGGYYVLNTGIYCDMEPGDWIDVLVANEYEKRMEFSFEQDDIYTDFVYIHDFEYEKEHLIYYKNKVDYLNLTWDGIDNKYYQGIIGHFEMFQEFNKVTFNAGFLGVNGNTIKIVHSNYELKPEYEMEYELSNHVKVVKGGVLKSDVGFGYDHVCYRYDFEGGEECSINDIKEGDTVDLVLDVEKSDLGEIKRIRIR